MANPAFRRVNVGLSCAHHPINHPDEAPDRAAISDIKNLGKHQIGNLVELYDSFRKRHDIGQVRSDFTGI